MTTLIKEVQAGPDAKVMVLFGGNPYRRHEVLGLVRAIGGVTAYGALGEAEGMTRLETLPRVDLVLIGGRYDEAERVRIRAAVSRLWPGAALTEPGYEYPYENGAIVADIRRKLGR